jgi:P27 family predicted phage terminase small subunit
VRAEGDPVGEPPPAHLSEAQRAVWTEVCANAPTRLWKNPDRFLLEAFVVTVAAFREASAMRAETPLLLKPTRGDRTVTVNPLNGEIRRQARLIGELGARLGMTPEARLRLLDGAARKDEGVDPEFTAMFGPLRLISGGLG